MSNVGRCNCGKFQFEAPPPQAVAVCFCRPCTRMGGSLASNNVVVKTADIKFTKGSLDGLKKYDEKDVDSGNKLTRAFCGDCGTAIISLPGEGDVGYLKLSAMEDQVGYSGGKEPNMVIFERNALPWVKESMLAHLPKSVQQVQ